MNARSGAVGWIGAAVVIAALGLGACAKEKADQRAAPVATAARDAGPAVDVEVMAFLSEARALHHEANVREDENDVAGAITVMRRLVTTERPHPGEHIPEVDEVLADAWARIAELELEARDLDAADKAIQEGLAFAPQPTYFRGHLLEVEGIVEEARAASLTDAGKKDEAHAARAKAIGLLHEAVEVQERVIGKALDGGAR